MTTSNYQDSRQPLLAKGASASDTTDSAGTPNVTGPAAGGPDPSNNPDYSIIIASEDGGLYKLNHEAWHRAEYLMKDTGGAGVVNQLVQFGTYLAFIPDVGAGVGEVCTLVNLKAILKNNEAAQTAAQGGTSATLTAQATAPLASASAAPAAATPSQAAFNKA